LHKQQEKDERKAANAFNSEARQSKAQLATMAAKAPLLAALQAPRHQQTDDTVHQLNRIKVEHDCYDRYSVAANIKRVFFCMNQYLLFLNYPYTWWGIKLKTNIGWFSRQALSLVTNLIVKLFLDIQHWLDILCST